MKEKENAPRWVEALLAGIVTEFLAAAREKSAVKSTVANVRS